MSTFTVSILVIFVFSFIPLIIAEIARNRSIPTIEDFFLYGRQMPTSMCFFTVYATWFSALAVLGSIGSVYHNGPLYMTAFAWNLLFAVLFFFIGKRIWAYGKQHNYMTPIDFFEDIYRFSPLTILSTVILLVFTIPYIQIQFSAGVYLIDIASGGTISWRISGLLFYAIMVVYLWAGGLRALTMTDVFYGILTFTTMVTSGILLVHWAGGLSAINQHFSNPQSTTTIVTMAGIDNSALWFAMFLVTPIGAIMSPPMWTRFYAVKSRNTFYIMPFLIGLATICYLGCIFAGNAAKIINPYLENENTIVLTLIAENATPIVMALLFCGFAAASLSTANSQIHALAGIYTKNVHQQLFLRKQPCISDKRLLYIGRWAVLGLSTIAYFVLLTDSTFILSTGLLALGGTMQLFVPVMGAFFWNKSNGKAATIGLATGIALLLILYFVAHLNSSFCGALAFAGNLLAFFVSCHLTAASPSTRERIVTYRTDYRNANH